MNQADYTNARMLDVAASLQGALEGLVTTPHDPMPLQVGAGFDLHGCGCLPTHCFRTISQRTLNVPTLFQSNPVGLAPGDIYFDELITGAGGALDGVAALPDGIIFNDSNEQRQRQRVYDLVLMGIRARVHITLQDNTVAATQSSVELQTLGNALADLYSEYIGLRIYHTSDRQNPWMDFTPLKYFSRENDEFLVVPAVKWIDRDPAMSIGLTPAAFNSGVFAGAGLPNLTTGIRTVLGQATISVETIFLPDPDVCGDYWPGQLCPPNKIANKATFIGAAIPTGKIQTPTAARQITTIVR